MCAGMSRSDRELRARSVGTKKRTRRAAALRVWWWLSIYFFRITAQHRTRASLPVPFTESHRAPHVTESPRTCVCVRIRARAGRAAPCLCLLRACGSRLRPGPCRPDVTTNGSRLPIEPLTALPAKSHMHAARSLDAWALFRYSVPSCAGLCAATVLSSRSALSGLTGLRAWARERLVLINVGDHFHVVESSELAMDHFHLIILL